MRIDWKRQYSLSDDEQQLLRLIRVARVFAAALVIGGIGAVAVTSDPLNAAPELARSGPPAASSGLDHSLMTLESGITG
jgi:hypothetical protein